jgi:hypothetical protein
LIWAPAIAKAPATRKEWFIRVASLKNAASSPKRSSSNYLRASALQSRILISQKEIPTGIGGSIQHRFRVSYHGEPHESQAGFGERRPYGRQRADLYLAGVGPLAGSAELLRQMDFFWTQRQTAVGLMVWFLPLRGKILE